MNGVSLNIVDKITYSELSLMTLKNAYKQKTEVLALLLWSIAHYSHPYFMLRKVNTNSRIHNLKIEFVTTSKWYILQVINWKISKHPHLSHLASLTLLAVYLAQNMLKTPYKKS